MSTTQSDRLRALLDPLVSRSGAELEEVKLTTAGRRRQLLVVVDSDGGVPLDLVAELSRGISKALDDSDVMGGAPYVLEVTSPGVDRPLTEPRHFKRALGRMVKAQLAGGGEVTARITDIDDEGLDLEVPGVKGRKPTRRRLAFDEIAKARVEVEFSRKSDDKLDPVGDDGSEADDRDTHEDSGAHDSGAHDSGAHDSADTDTDSADTDSGTNDENKEEA
ncbi:ribosome maturation factor RimP [Wenjunlia tyrosinilytica]|uniref:Ribosome maturation factor RimP n=1 Tax=Wenjunlia tyrosinilytica TaxID=1544741 RepID=A0A918E056_9ACTN|nr:ribosome maturation factor RimP [Wenjunlia tyrosinilytica]GGO93569.1 ribosome maturation factor RimP [Wenjunlia tyrosinilytica]